MNYYVNTMTGAYPVINHSFLFSIMEGEEDYVCPFTDKRIIQAILNGTKMSEIYKNSHELVLEPIEEGLNADVSCHHGIWDVEKALVLSSLTNLSDKELALAKVAEKILLLPF
jgi:hypothetical protein